jgi:lysozyme
MNYSDAGLDLTEESEGCRLVAYQDSVGVWTIGYGHTQGVHAGMTCTQAQAEVWLREDIMSAIADVNRLVKVPLTQGEFDALVDFDFNLGGGALRGSTLLRLLNAGDHASAAEQFERWDKAGGHVLAGLLRRRLAEEAEFKGVSTA